MMAALTSTKGVDVPELVSADGQDNRSLKSRSCVPMPVVKGIMLLTVFTPSARPDPSLPRLPTHFSLADACEARIVHMVTQETAQFVGMASVCGLALVVAWEVRAVSGSSI